MHLRIYTLLCWDRSDMFCYLVVIAEDKASAIGMAADEFLSKDHHRLIGVVDERDVAPGLHSPSLAFFGASELIEAESDLVTKYMERHGT